MGLKKNILYNSFLTGANFIFPFITYPYLSRVLGVDHIGICNFSQSVINFFLLFSTLGSTVLGIRETAKFRENKEELSHVFSSIFFLNIICTCCIIIVYFITTLNMGVLKQYKDLFLIGSIQIAFTPFLIEWFYQGLENFKYITLRSLFVRILYAISIFLFIKNESDYDIYFALTILSMTINAIFNWTYKKNFVKLSIHNLQLKKYTKPFLLFGIYRMLTFMYVSFNTVFLGMVSTTTEVGYYTTSTKLLSIFMAFFSAMSTVIMPHISNHIGNNNVDDIKIINYKSFELIIPVSLGLIVLCEILAPEIILLIAGSGYEGAIIPFRIISPLILIIGISNILIIQTLTPLGQDRAILINSILGAFMGICLNILLVKNWNSIGSAWAWFGSEFMILLSALYFTIKKNIQIIPLKLLWFNILLTIPILLVLLCLRNTSLNYILRLIIGIITVLVMSFISQRYILKNSVFLSLLPIKKNKKG